MTGEGNRAPGFAQRYGPWALIAGGSEGIGAAFATAVAERGLDVLVVGRRPEPLAALASRLPARAVPIRADLSTPGGLAAVYEATAGLDVGLVVANAAHAPIGTFADSDPASLERAVDLNCRAPVSLARHYLPAMVARRSGGFILMSSFAGRQGAPRLATYAATKAFGAVLAEGLWAELRGQGVDVLACVAGAVATESLRRAKRRAAPGTVSPDQVVATALRALGRRPTTVPGGFMRVAAQVTSRLLPRRAAIAVIGRGARDVTG